MSPPQSEDFFDEIKEWSARKHHILGAYLQGFVRILGQAHAVHRVNYVDGFAGQGTYGKEKAKGSPLLAAELAREYRRSGKPYGLLCINVESDPEYFQDLQSATVEFKDLVLNLQGAFADNVTRIFEVIGTRPTLFFLDPFGVNHVFWEDIWRIARRREPTDLWLRFDYKTVLRLAGFYPPETSEGFAKLEILKRFYGVQDVREVLREIDAQGQDKRIERAIEFYLDKLRKEFRQARGDGYTAAYPIRAITGESKYVLVFASASPKAFVLASDIVYHREEDYHKEAEEIRSKLQQQLQLFSLEPNPDDVFAAKVTELKNEVWQRCHGQTLTRLAVHALVLDNWFGRMSRKHLTAALKTLQEEGQFELLRGPIGEDQALLKFRLG